MSVKISKMNSKLGTIPSVNLPPITTCRKNCPCAKDCYANKGNFRYKTVQESMKRNYAEYLSNRDGYFEQIMNAVNNGIVSYNYFRWHAAGDIIDDYYFSKMVECAVRRPLTQFLAFTKKFEIVNDYIRNGGVIPQNLRIVFSAWGDSFKVDNPYDFPIAYVRLNSDRCSSIPENAEECSGNCTNCLKCWNINNGQSVVFNKH